MEINKDLNVIVQVQELKDIGISSENIMQIYKNTKSINIKKDDFIKVSAIDEGKNINFETWDNVSIIVPVHLANGSFNKFH